MSRANDLKKLKALEKLVSDALDMGVEVDVRAQMNELRWRIAQPPEDADLAEYLHEKFCSWNHTDGCGWFYETDDRHGCPTWGQSTHADWLNKARELRKFLGKL